jgi:DNA-binding LacI/PurR family transcriptional regulator
MPQDRHVNDHAADPAEPEPGRGRAPNIRDVARLAGVSYQTVSRVLNDHPSIRDSTRDRVLAVIAETGYRPNPAARALVTSRSRTIGVLTSQSSQYGPATSIAAIEIAARDAGYRSSVTSIATTDVSSIRAALDYLMSQSVEALVVIAPQQRVLEVVADIAPDVPYVTLQMADLAEGHGMSTDHTLGARLATRHLIELGHTEILHISGPQDWIEAEARMQGYLDEIDAADLRTRAPILGDWSAHFGYYAGLELLRVRQQRPDGARLHACLPRDGSAHPRRHQSGRLRRHPRGGAFRTAADDGATELRRDRPAGGGPADGGVARGSAGPRPRRPGAHRARIDGRSARFAAGLTDPHWSRSGHD